jgi:TonB family protein
LFKNTVVCLTGIPIIALSGIAAEAKCPLESTNFVLAGIGHTGRLYRYELTVRTSNVLPVSAQLPVSSANAAPTTVDAAYLVLEPGSGTNAGATITFMLPQRYVTGVTVTQIVDRFTEKKTTCLDPEHQLDAAAPPSEFDDTSTAAKSLVAAEPLVTDLTRARSSTQFLRRVMPRYPSFEQDQGHEGTVSVEVVVGRGGAVLQADVAHSSGWRNLDNAALDAARASIFFELSIGGEPVVAKYIIDYSFALPN